jgi:cystathionine beta-lyase/cystathionine gamma-synthase
MAYPTLDHSNTNYAGRIVRFNIGFEDADDLKEDLAIAFASLRASLLNTVHE